MTAEIRAQLADAANALDGINVAPYYRQAAKPGAGFVRLDTITYPNVFAGLMTWQVIVVAPGDVAAGERWLDETIPALVDALGEAMTVTTVELRELALDTGRAPCVVITGNRETPPEE